MKKISINVIIVILLVIIIGLAIENLNNKNSNIAKQETGKEQLTATSSSNAYITLADHLSETSASTDVTLLWENPSPNSTMAANTTITLSSNNYTLLLVLAKVYYTSEDDASHVTALVRKGESPRLSGFMFTTGAASAYRGLGYVNDTTYTTGKPWVSINGEAPAVNNKYMIPYRIYGIK